MHNNSVGRHTSSKIERAYGGVEYREGASIYVRGYGILKGYGLIHVTQEPLCSGIKVNSESLRDLQIKYEGEVIMKGFGFLGDFEGTVREIWLHDEGTYRARVEYKDDDVEDMSIQELDGLLKLRSARGEKCRHDKPLVLKSERTPVVELAMELNKVKVEAVNRSLMVIEPVTCREPETLCFDFETKLELMMEPAQTITPNIPSQSVIVRKALSGPPGLSKPHIFCATSLEHTKTEAQFWQKGQGEDSLVSTTREYPEEELGVIRFAFLSCLDQWGFVTIPFGLLPLKSVFYFRYYQWMERWLFSGWDPPTLACSKLKFAGKSVAWLHFSNFNSLLPTYQPTSST